MANIPVGCNGQGHMLEFWGLKVDETMRVWKY